MELIVCALFFVCLYLKIKISSLEKTIANLKSSENGLALFDSRLSRLSGQVETLIRAKDDGPLTKDSPDDCETRPDSPEREKTCRSIHPDSAGGDVIRHACEIPEPDATTHTIIRETPPTPPPLPDIDENSEDETQGDSDETWTNEPKPALPAPTVSSTVGSEPVVIPPEGEKKAGAGKEAGLSRDWAAFRETVDWELFTGTRLFAWLGVFALFLGILFFLKLSMDRGWFPPALRLSLAAATGLALCLFSVKRMNDRLALLRHTLAAAGVGVLYGVVFAATLYYDYLPKPAGFMLLSLITATAFVLAVFHRGLSISILGALGAFLTPVLVNTGSGSLSLLFAYLTLVNTGLYLVMTRLSSPVLLLVGSAGTLVTLALGTFDTIHSTSPYESGGVWTANTLLFSLTLFLQRHRSIDGNRSLRQTGILTFAPALGAALVLTLAKPGWMPLVLITSSLACGLVLTWFQKQWRDLLIAFAGLSFAAVLAWTLLRFDVRSFSTAFVLIFIYGAVGCLGPLVLVARHGLTPRMALWFKQFPVAVSALVLLGLFRNPGCSFLFWPVILGVQILGLFVSLLFRAFFQMIVLIVLFVSGGLFWMFHIPREGMNLSFFLFILVSGFLVTGLIVLAAGRLPDLLRTLRLNGEDTGKPLAWESWLTAAPSTGVAVLLGAAFMVPFPHFPHPGMVTLCCFLTLSLFFSRRTGFEPTAVLCLISALFSQAVWVLLPHSGLILKGMDVLQPALAWSAGLFTVALAAPFFFYRNHDTGKKTWSAFALFEVVQFLFFFVSAKRLFQEAWVPWLPLVPALVKLPLVALLLRQLEGKACRNSLLAFHGGVLLFYVSALPVLLLDHGWLGLALVLEGTALLWLNTRISHPGLRKVAAVMSPVGLFLLVLHLPHLKTELSLNIINPAVLSVAGAVLALSAAVRLIPVDLNPSRGLSLNSYYRWMAVFAGLFLVNLAVADVFAPRGTVFRILPDGSFLQSATYALFWALFGGMIWKWAALSPTMRKTGFFILSTGALTLIALPVLMPRGLMAMAPFFNPAFVTYAAMVFLLFFLFRSKPWNDGGDLEKKLVLTFFLATLFMAIKVLKFTLLQNGDPFTLMSERTVRHALASAAATFVYGTALLIWPRRLDRPFRLAGLALVFAGLVKSALFPLIFSPEFGHMTPIVNLPGLLYLFLMAALIFFSMRPWKEPWPLNLIRPRPLWPVIFAVFAFYVMNVEIASFFGRYGFTFSTAGNWGKSFGYSLGWLVFAIGLLAAGIRLESKRTRWAAIGLLSVTAGKIFFRDLWALGQLYRVGSFIGLAVVLILVSYLYQRFIAADTDQTNTAETKNGGM